MGELEDFNAVTVEQMDTSEIYYSIRIFIELKKALNIRRHEHFWDTYHLNEKNKSFFKPYPKDLQDVCFKAIQTHDKELLKTVFDTCEGLITDEEEMNQLLSFKRCLGILDIQNQLL